MGGAIGVLSAMLGHGWRPALLLPIIRRPLEVPARIDLLPVPRSSLGAIPWVSRNTNSAHYFDPSVVLDLMTALVRGYCPAHRESRSLIS